MHNWLVWLLGEVALPSRTKLFHVVLLKLLLGRSDLHARLDTIGSQRTRAIHVPLIEDLLLCLRVTTKEVIKALGTRLGTIDRESKVMILEVETDTRKVDFGLDADFLKLLGITDTGALEHKRSAERPAGDDNLLACFDLTGAMQLVRGERLHWADLHGGGSVTIENDFVDLGVAHEV